MVGSRVKLNVIGRKAPGFRHGDRQYSAVVVNKMPYKCIHLRELPFSRSLLLVSDIRGNRIPH